eukprot:gene2923-4464_t
MIPPCGSTRTMAVYVDEIPMGDVEAVLYSLANDHQTKIDVVTVQDMLTSMDEDGSNSISYDEFLDAFEHGRFYEKLGLSCGPRAGPVAS